jgi:amidase
MDTVGPFGRSVEDAAMVLGIIQEKHAASDAPDDRLDSLIIHEISSGSYTSWLNKKDALKGARFGLPWKRVWEIASKSAESGRSTTLSWS